MGIKNLKQTLKDRAPESIKILTSDMLRGKTVAVDIASWIYAFATTTAIVNPVHLLVTLDEEAIHEGILKRTQTILQARAIPVFVFDGNPPECKERTLQKRRESRQSIFERAKKCDNMPERAKLLRQTIRPSRDTSERIRESLSTMGLITIAAPGEAEAQCAHMCSSGKVWAVVSVDSDTLVFGAPRVIQNFSSKEMREGKTYILCLETILCKLGMNIQQFTDYCILCGCDYTGTLKGIGPKRAFEGICNHGTIENFIHYTQSIEKKPKKRKRNDTNSSYVNLNTTTPIVEECGANTSPDNECNFELARRMFKEPDVIFRPNIDATTFPLNLMINNISDYLNYYQTFSLCK